MGQYCWWKIIKKFRTSILSMISLQKPTYIQCASGWTFEYHLTDFKKKENLLDQTLPKLRNVLKRKENFWKFLKAVKGVGEKHFGYFSRMSKFFVLSWDTLYTKEVERSFVLLNKIVKNKVDEWISICCY